MEEFTTVRAWLQAPSKILLNVGIECGQKVHA